VIDVAERANLRLKSSVKPNTNNKRISRTRDDRDTDVDSNLAVFIYQSPF
jgi:hypothetical protein